MLFTIQASIDASKKLNELLTELQAGKIQLVEYRTNDWPGAAGCYLRVRWQGTAGGMQFSVRTINSLGQEGSGFYTPDQREMATACAKFLERFHAPSPFRARLEQMRAKSQSKETTWDWMAVEEPPPLHEDLTSVFGQL